MMHLNEIDILLSVMAAIIVGGIIGYERESKNKPAGIKTHILVCVGAALIALIQREIVEEVGIFVINNQELKNTISIRTSDIIANVVTGIGFLGAGTIIINKGKVEGLTTAATLWLVAVVGIAIGMGFWLLSLAGTIAIIIALEIINRLFVGNYELELSITFKDKANTLDKIKNYNYKNNLKILTVDQIDDENIKDDIYIVDYTLSIPKNIMQSTIMLDLSLIPDVIKIVVKT
ncbi:MgtC/SapB family protein [Mycoplasma sp. P36-A1]|uniref:MgtC/SapB family protein n=1 Tax=Mycoplasma sp. P36-A1 TaxID=3252900 RepID=UPI003C2FC863